MQSGHSQTDLHIDTCQGTQNHPCGSSATLSVTSRPVKDNKYYLIADI